VLCLLLGQLLALPGQRQRLLLMLAFGADLVPRMWFSLLKGLVQLWEKDTILVNCGCMCSPNVECGTAF
jgi:hypothetical protein